MTTTRHSTLAPSGGTVSLADIRQTISQTRVNFTRLRGVPRVTRDKAPAPDFITLICLISEIYRSYGDDLGPVQQFHPSRETQYNRGHTSSVSHTQISRHAASMVSQSTTTTRSEGIIVKRPRQSIFEEKSYALVSFITELRIRTHPPLKDHPNIARLRGVGWDFEDEEATVPRPLLLEELAPQGALDNFWVKWDFVRLNFKSKLDLARNIADGLLALHNCGVVHGDVKPENVLVFPRRDADNAFVAKLTDFGHSVFESSRSNALPAFTPKWCAPELSPDATTSRTMVFREMKLTDVYSYGLVVLSIMLSCPFHERIENVEAPKLDDSMLTKAIELLDKEDREKQDSDLDLSTIRSLMRRTVRLNPAHRDLDQCMRIMERYDRVNGNKLHVSPQYTAGKDQVIEEPHITDMVAVGHATFAQTSHQLKAHIVESLLRIATDDQDPRRLATAWELSVCYYSGFGVPASFEHCSRWLTIASEGGVVAAQNYFEVLHGAMNLPCPVQSGWKQRGVTRVSVTISEDETAPSIKEPEPLEQAMEGSDDELEIEDLHDGSIHNRIDARIEMPKELGDILSRGSLDGLRCYLDNYPESLNSQDFDGNTPLLLSAMRQQVDILEFLADQPSVNAGIPSRSGHTVLHFLPSLDCDVIKVIVPKLVRRKADLYHESLAMPLAEEDTIFTSGISCCSVLNAILHGNLVLLGSLLEAFRRILAISLSIFQAGALTMLIGHVNMHLGSDAINLGSIEVWAGSSLLPLHKVPFNSVAIGALDLPESLFRAINYGDRSVQALQGTIQFLLSTQENSKKLAYTMLIEAVKSHSLQAVQFLLEEGRRRQFPIRWWIRFPLDRSPFMLSITLGFREIFKYFLQHDSTLLQEPLALPCCLPACEHRPKVWETYYRILLGQPKAVVVAADRKHKFNHVQRALWLLVDSRHQDSFFVIQGGLSALAYSLRLDGGDFLEQAILFSLFSMASTIIDRFPDVFRKRSRCSGLCLWRSKERKNLKDTSRGSIVRVLREGSKEQCRFVLERLLPLRTCDSRHECQSEKIQKHEEGVPAWFSCPLTSEEFHNLVRGNIMSIDIDREDLWDVVEVQVRLGHRRSVSYLRLAILHGNTDALRQLLQRGWNPNGPVWARLKTPLQYSQDLKKLNGDFGELFKYWNPDLPQTDWKDSRTHAIVYEAYKKQHQGHNWAQWYSRLGSSQEILRSHGGKASPLAAFFNEENETLRLWTFVGFVLLYAVVLPLILTYATKGTWTSMSTGQKLGFSYMWSALAVFFPPLFLFCVFAGSLFTVNHIVLPILVIRVNWRPFLSCMDVVNTESGSMCSVATQCTNYSFLLPIAVAGIEVLLTMVAHLETSNVTDEQVLHLAI
ncbi:hypothetical protein F5Y15DRAFT_408851 [Xylariaceae sp. FL0016]|nr:hypothetical protein F5Y15DRAFT_408851 [Xylariaceae sp. FL0016]